MSLILFDGKLVGEVDDGLKLVQKLRAKRRAGEISPFINFAYDDEEDVVIINTTNDRVVRPLIVVEDGKPKVSKEDIQLLQQNKITFMDLVKQGKIEFLDADEEENAYVSLSEEELTPEHTHLELSYISILGIPAGMIPFLNHSSAARSIIGVKSVKQGLGLYASNYLLRVDNDRFVAIDQQKPIVRTITYDLAQADKHPAGQNAVVAVVPYLGYNMDDAIIINKAAIQRGMFRAFYFRPYKAEEMKYPGGRADEITIPDKDISGYRSEYAYRHLDADGIARPGSIVEEGDVVIGRVSPPRFASSIDKFRLGVVKKVETSAVAKKGEGGVVDQCYITTSQDGNKYVIVKIREDRSVDMGDKFELREGQKGVVGMVLDPADMPFTQSGIIPDILFSPYSIPSRLTFSVILELLAGKSGAINGKYYDATPFTSVTEEEIRSELIKAGFRDDGLEAMYNGITGDLMKARIFVGVGYYIRLKHVTKNKLQWRSRGPVQILSRQPTEGKAKGGGLRLGEMEKDAIIAHGAAAVLQDKFSVDSVKVAVCTKCGLVGIYNFKSRTGSCPVHGDNAPMELIDIPAPFNILLNEMKAMGIYPRLILGSKYEA
ncbi:MAG: DNA-directed RNA polymerase subunit B [Candidatus Rehaiarchaeum fermentans]|nr:DNA-directed RNA polymerase subunit B [Candidatus Rehaiarchaeum fermentans]